MSARRLGHALLVLAAAAAALTIWAPIGHWWQWALTVVLLVAIAAGILGNRDQGGAA